MTDNVNKISVIWSRLIKELAHQQNLSPIKEKGQVVNPIAHQVYSLDTACTAKAFAVEYKKTNDEVWLQRSKLAIQSLNINDIAIGLYEPMWSPLGWYRVEKSLAATGMALDALWDSMSMLNVDFEITYYKSLLDLLQKCYHGKGRFAHNAILNKNCVSDVQNTTAVALVLLECIAANAPHINSQLFQQRNAAVKHLMSGQTKDGYWSYIYPNKIFRLALKCPKSEKIPLLRRLYGVVNFGDMLHQVMIVYNLLKYVDLSNNTNCLDSIKIGWEWICNRLLWQGEELLINWECEPKPAQPRYCNFRDTNAYFWILSLLPLLEKNGIHSKTEVQKTAEGIINHIYNKLLKCEGEVPCIQPLEGPVEVVRNILPAFDHGVAWKAAFLADYVIYLSIPV